MLSLPQVLISVFLAAPRKRPLLESVREEQTPEEDLDSMEPVDFDLEDYLEPGELGPC